MSENIQITQKEDKVIMTESEEKNETINLQENITEEKGTNLEFLNKSDTKNDLSGLVFWLKLCAISTWIGSGLLFLIGLIYIIFIIGPIIYWPLAGLSIWFGIMLWKAAEYVKQIQLARDQDEFNTLAISFMKQVKTYAKANGIYTIITFIIFFIFVVLAIVFFAYAFSVNSYLPRSDYPGNFMIR
jgi:hypothetical protein